MDLLRTLLVVVALAAGAAVVVLGAPGSIGATAAAHPEPNDLDGDLILNADDNCPTTANGTQLNTDGDAEGDACDADDDNDGVPDVSDNCRVNANPGQENTVTPGDAYGDACEPVDTDLDGFTDDKDNCVSDANPGQEDLDGDGEPGSPRGGDACDRDDDNDRINDPVDNCPRVYNPPAIFAPPYTQDDLDGDGIGSACDPEELIAGPAGPPTTTTPGTGGGGGGGGGAATPADVKAPTVTVRVQRRQRHADAGKALIVTVTCSEACSIDALLAADAKAVRRARLGSKRVVLATGTWSLAGAGKTYLFARYKPVARRLRAGRSLKASLRVTAADAAGNKRTVTKTVELRK